MVEDEEGFEYPQINDEPASVSCSLCRNSLSCKRVLRVTNIYVISLCVFAFQSLSSAQILSSSFTSVSVACRTAA